MEIDIKKFLEEARDIPVIDVRTPSEFRQGKIPVARNIPLFTDSERRSIGITYSKSGRQKAVLEGLETVGPNLKSYVKQARKIAKGNRLLVHCWRGGMRSASMAWLFETSGIQCQVLKGGYKSFRTKVLSFLDEPFPFIIIGGLTGSGKTEVLRALALKGEQILDLEGLAHHKGSAFGHLGESVQNTNEQFENDIFWRLYHLDPERPVWVEDESRGIGRNTLPGGIYRCIRQSPVIFLDVPMSYRLKRLVNDYAAYPDEQLLESIVRISKHLGGKTTREASDAVLRGDYQNSARLVLKYYDKTYKYGLSRREEGTVFKLTPGTFHPVENLAEQILEFAGQMAPAWKLSN